MLKNLALTLIAIFAPIQATLITAGSLVIIDFILGIAAALKTGVPITSFRMRDSIGKLLAYELTLLIGYLAQHYLTADKLPMVNIASTYIAIIEGTSCLENLNAITGQNLLTAIISKINKFKE